MNPIAARAAFRAATTATTRRQFSGFTSLRTFARSFESHPFERLPVKTAGAASDWGRLVKRSAAQGAVYVSPQPLIVIDLRDSY